MDVRLEALRVAAAQMGRGAVLIGVGGAYTPGDLVTVGDTERWDGSGPLNLAHVGTTEGEIAIAADVALSELTFTEYTGPAAHKRYYDGEGVTITIPFHFADPRLRAICSPIGQASGGYSRQRPVREHTLVIVPEQLLYDPSSNDFEALTWAAGTGFQVGGSPLTEEQTRLLGLSMWFWKGSFGRQLPSFNHDNGGKTINPVEFSVMHSPEFPEGNMLYTLGDPTTEQIDLAGFVS